MNITGPRVNLVDPRVLLIENPLSRRSREPVNKAARILTEKGWHIERQMPNSIEELRRLARGSCNYEIIAIAGGDGTLSEFAGALPESAPPILLLPRGTANVIANDLGLMLSPFRIARKSMYLVEKRIKLGGLRYSNGNLRRFVLSTGAGFIADAVQSVSPGLKRITGKAAYAASLVSALSGQRQDITVAAHGEEFTGEALIATLTNHYAGGFCLSPHTRPDDGLIDLFVIRSATEFPRFLLDALRGRAANSPAVVHRRASAFAITSSGPLETDGDIAEYSPAEITLCGTIEMLGLPS